MVVKRKAAYSGAEGFAKSEEVNRHNKERAEARKAAGGNNPFRFSVPVGETKQAIIVDDEPQFFRFEHTLKTPGTNRWNTHTGCVAEFDTCPICEATGKEGYFAMYLTVIDLTPFEDKAGKTHEFSKKLLVVKSGQQQKFKRIYERAVSKGETLRGALLEFARDGERDPAIGNDIELIEYVDEDELETYVRSWKDKEGKKHTENCAEPFDYEALYPKPDVEDLRKIVGAEAPLGARESSRPKRNVKVRPGKQEDPDDDDDDDAADDGDWKRPERSERMGRTGKVAKPARRAKQEDPDDDTDDDADADDAPPPRSRRAAPVKEEPARAARTGRRAKVEEPDDSDDDADDPDDAPARPARRAAAAVRGRR